MTDDDRDLIRRLLEQSEQTAAPDAPPAPAQPSPAPPEPDGATFLVHDDWDGSHRKGHAIAVPSLDARARLRAELRDPASPLRRAVRVTLWVLAGLGAIVGAYLLWMHLTTDPIADARAYYDAATRLNADKPLYPKNADPNVAEFYRYPPLLAIALRPLALLPYTAFALAWEGIVIGSFVALVWRLGWRSSRTWVALGLLAGPIAWAIAIGQAQVPLTLLLAIGQPWSIALAANLKLFPALAALWWIGRRDYQATIAFVLYAVMLGLLQLLIEPEGTITYLQRARLDWIGQVNNLSPYAISPELWAVLLAAGIAVTLLLARTRAGWPLAVVVASLSQPRLFLYMFTSLLAAVREPKQANLEEPEPRPWLLVSGSGRH